VGVPVRTPGGVIGRGDRGIGPARGRVRGEESGGRPPRALGELGVDGDIAAEQRLDAGAAIADDAARSHRDAAHEAEIAHDPMAGDVVRRRHQHGPLRSLYHDHSMILATTPAPTVRPPSRMAKRRFSSIAIGTISSTVIATLSPGITISVPSGRCTTPVTSVVRK